MYSDLDPRDLTGGVGESSKIDNVHHHSMKCLDLDPSDLFEFLRLIMFTTIP